MHWSSRNLAAELGSGISHTTVARIWAKHGLQPCRLEGYIASDDLDFETKAVGIIGLYLNPLRYSMSTRRRGFRHWIARTPCCRCPPGGLRIPT